MAQPMEDFRNVRGELAAFTARLEHLILEKKSLLQTEKKRHTENVRRLEQAAHRLRAEIADAQEKRGAVAGQIEAGLAKFRATESMVNSLTKDLQKAQNSRASLRAAVDAKRAHVDSLKDSLRYTRSSLDSQAEKDEDEATKFEMYVGLRVESVDEDLLRFKFTNIDANEIDLDVLVELYVGDDLYRVLATDPALPADTISTMERELNESGMLVVFLKRIRKALRDALD
ncbi:hypothetical protein METBIDRAFT_76275 [Metschnikowia bicuspidata var. bicuspidata NRRL YB-4993]|uniref:Kinetochore protein SPC25 n=1 Tax=Metschnikowia bicuspidata var. bicuspidata NRRL YB-4993 TaxID=869754 RepID=A0A1A0HHA2_9ASCO|nr:hypothetical protein METBIDRAFT_76275 [Metschnikowia bicuspidata var. bicuspidata NRRL YB-4993]OBA23218.1 hypothetical protein METBIDRAFT_76275 [Metschnikowia bicuspidata var. bicuspidata NRRL YB-4993]